MFWWKVYILKVSKWLHIKWGKLHPLQFIFSLKVSSFAATCGQHSWIPIKNAPIAEAPEALLSYCRLACLVHIWKLLFSILSWICMKFTTFKEFSTHILLDYQASQCSFSAGNNFPYHYQKTRSICQKLYAQSNWRGD